MSPLSLEARGDMRWYGESYRILQLAIKRDDVKSFMKTLGFILNHKRCGIISWLELETCKCSA
jgi:hypothetical protein